MMIINIEECTRNSTYMARCQELPRIRPSLLHKVADVKDAIINESGV